MYFHKVPSSSWFLDLQLIPYSGFANQASRTHIYYLYNESPRSIRSLSNHCLQTVF